ncbi:hypothetical protein HDU93_006282 [Gonapodya sp. JEL0774]|nr:hypothetical protein HDU93_006282 [Gonapodya sp. JEL0774]
MPPKTASTAKTKAKPAADAPAKTKSDAPAKAPTKPRTRKPKGAATATQQSASLSPILIVIGLLVPIIATLAAGFVYRDAVIPHLPPQLKVVIPQSWLPVELSEFHKLEATDINGTIFKFDKLRGKNWKVLMVEANHDNFSPTQQLNVTSCTGELGRRSSGEITSIMVPSLRLSLPTNSLTHVPPPQVVLIVNVASKCSYTPQYGGLQDLYAKFRDRGLEVLAFPSNEFGQQEPGGDKEIGEFARNGYKVEEWNPHREAPELHKATVAGAPGGKRAGGDVVLNKVEGGGWLWVWVMLFSLVLAAVHALPP